MPTEDINVAIASKKLNWDSLNPEIKYEGRAITLPGDPGKMPPRKAIEALTRLVRDEEQDFQVREFIEGYPHDAAVAFVKAMTKLYGWASPQSVMTMFGPKPPVMVSVKTGIRDEDVIQCPLGSFALPGIESPINTMFYEERGKTKFLVHGVIKKKDRHVILELVTEARRIVKDESIYRGKSIRLGVDHEGNLDLSNPPGFFDASDTTTDSVLLDADIMEQIETSILTPIRKTDECRAHKIPLKRGILLEGPYGTGKSLTSRMTAAVCAQNGWTFVLLDKVQGLQAALEFANRYSPAVVFAEDIDRIAENRDESANDLINTIDGVLSKRAEIMTILTTNFAEKLDQVILRPGRLDAVISLRAPSAETAERLIRYYAGYLLTDMQSVTRAGQELAGQIPASIRECVERAKLGMVSRGDKTLLEIDLVIAAKTMKNHLNLLNRDNKKTTAAERLATSLQEVVGQRGGSVLAEKVNSVYAMVDIVNDRTLDIKETVNEINNTVN
jgi:transitional endoplasmic reticulum ATPase